MTAIVYDDEMQDRLFSRAMNCMRKEKLLIPEEHSYIRAAVFLIGLFCQKFTFSSLFIVKSILKDARNTSVVMFRQFW